MFLRSLFYERTVLSHLERVRQLPPEAQAEIAMRVSNFIELARPVSDDLLSRFAQVAREEQQRAVEQGARSDTDPLWAAPALSEAWYNARLGLATRNLTRHSAIEIITAIEIFTIKGASQRQHSFRLNVEACLISLVWLEDIGRMSCQQSAASL